MTVLLIATAWLLAGVLVSRRHAPPPRPPGTAGGCPRCGFTYAFDGTCCAHCKHRILRPLRAAAIAAVWPIFLVAEFVRRIRTARSGEPAHSHPGRVVAPGTPLREAMRGNDDQEPEVATMQELLQDVFSEIEIVREPLAGIPTGFAAVDDLLGGLRPGQLYVVAGRSAMGKTAFALAVVEHAALREEKTVLVFSRFKVGNEIGLRMVCSGARVDPRAVLRGETREEEFQRLVMAAGALSGSRILVDEAACATGADLLRRARRVKAASGVDLVVLDDADGMGVELPGTLRRLAEDLDVPVLASVTIDAAGVPDRIVQEADAVLILSKEGFYLPRQEPHEVCDVTVTKNTSGLTGQVTLALSVASMRMEDPGRMTQPD